MLENGAVGYDENRLSIYHEVNTYVWVSVSPIINYSPSPPEVLSPPEPPGIDHTVFECMYNSVRQMA